MAGLRRTHRPPPALLDGRLNKRDVYVINPRSLSEQPDWHASAQSLVSGLVALNDTNERIGLLESICRQLGDDLYPAFLQLLHVIDQCADTAARRIVAETLVSCLISGRLPAGKYAAWGSSGLTGDSAFGQTRNLGPLEFVCAWYAQAGSRTELSREQFTTILSSLVSLISADERARTLYLQKLNAEMNDPMSGSLSSKTRAGMQALTEAWQSGSSSTDIVNAFLATLQTESPLHQLARRGYEDY